VTVGFSMREGRMLQQNFYSSVSR